MESRIKAIVRNRTNKPLVLSRLEVDENTHYIESPPKEGHKLSPGEDLPIVIQNAGVLEAQGTIEFTQDDEYFMSNLIWVCDGKLDVDESPSSGLEITIDRIEQESTGEQAVYSILVEES